MGKTQSKYPIGQQDFRNLRNEGAIYVDKTSFIEKIIKSSSRYYFLARPRRFGKSLFLSTLRYFFEAKRELFKDLHIDSADWDWQTYPVLRLDLNINRYDEPGLLDSALDGMFREWEDKYEVKYKGDDLSSRFRSIIKAAHEKTGQQVVILVDEYDKPLVGNLNNDVNFEHYRVKLASVYSNFKSSAEHIRLVFLTGVSRFSKLSVFSDLNNINDITFENDYADICGITENELLESFQQGIVHLAEEEEITYEEAVALLKSNYDGYRFAAKGSDIYNPWSVLNAMDKSDILNYWTLTGTPAIVAESLRNFDADLEKMLNTHCSAYDLAGLDLKSPNPVALMYQTGYLTIKDYDKQSRIFTLGVPNNEVKENLFKVLIPYYVKVKGNSADSVASDIINNIIFGEPEQLFRNLQTYLAGIPYEMGMDNERNFQNAVYILLSLIGVKSKVEEHTSDGRMDLTVETPRYIYIVELKFDGTAEEALAQIVEKKYARKYQTDHRKVFCIGANFSSATRCIEDWKIQG